MTVHKKPRLTLRFTNHCGLKLVASEFEPPVFDGESPSLLRCSEGKSGDGQFEWREGTQALCVCLLRYVCYPKSALAKGIRFQFIGQAEHPAKSVDNVLAKANKANCWQQAIFGYLGEGNCRLGRYIKRKNPNPSYKKPNYESEVQDEELPQESIVIELNGKKVRAIKQLAHLANEIEDQWFKLHPRYKAAWGEIKKRRNVKMERAKVNKKKARSKTKTIYVTVQEEPKKRRLSVFPERRPLPNLSSLPSIEDRHKDKLLPF